MSDIVWFTDRSDAKKYLGEVVRVWLTWLVGLAALVVSRGRWAVVAGVAVLVVLFMVLAPLQNRVQGRFDNRADPPDLPTRRLLSPRDMALRELTYGREPFAQAIEQCGLWRGLRLAPWAVIFLTLVAAAVGAMAWIGD